VLTLAAVAVLLLSLTGLGANGAARGFRRPYARAVSGIRETSGLSYPPDKRGTPTLLNRPLGYR